MRACGPRKSKSFAPRSGLLQERHSAYRATDCGSRDPRRMRACGPRKSKRFAPRRGSYKNATARTEPPCVGAATRGECGLAARSGAKASPRGRGSYKKATARPQRFSPEARPAAITEAQKTKPRTGRGLSSSRPASGRGVRDSQDQALIRDLYSPVRVSISIESPISQKAETCSSAPFFRRAVFMTLPEVSPRTDGSV